VRVPIQSISVVLKLACLADIFNYLNTVNTSMQGKNEKILTSTDKPSAFRKKNILSENAYSSKKNGRHVAFGPK